MKSASLTVWIGRILSALICIPFLMSVYLKLYPDAQTFEGLSILEISFSILKGLSILELVCVILYMIPNTAILGAILLTGYMGGAILAHLRVGDPYFLQIAFGIVIWLGIYLREPRLRQILPLR